MIRILLRYMVINRFGIIDAGTRILSHRMLMVLMALMRSYLIDQRCCGRWVLLLQGDARLPTRPNREGEPQQSDYDVAQDCHSPSIPEFPGSAIISRSLSGFNYLSNPFSAAPSKVFQRFFCRILSRSLFASR